MDKRSLLVLWLAAAACSDDDGGARRDGGPDGDGDADGDAGGEGEGEASCGNGVVDDGEQCERLGCSQGDVCTANCTCEALSADPPTSQDLIQLALERGEIDYATSLMYRVWALFQAPELPEAYDGEGSAGEDFYLFMELSNYRGSLPAEVETAIAPYLVRPNDPLSVYSLPPFREVDSHDRPPPVACPQNAADQADWRPHGTDHFVVWSCGGGVNGADEWAGARTVAGTVLEQAWAELVPRLGAPKVDDFPNGPEPRTRIDAYLLEPNQCRYRQGVCQPVRGRASASAVPASPCGGDGGGPVTSSGYIIMPVMDVPDDAPSLSTPSPWRSTLVHELFHVISFNLNLQAQGGTCAPRPQMLPEELRSWLSEASANWAGFGPLPRPAGHPRADDDPDERTALFRGFQRERNNSWYGLHSTKGLHPYEAYLYPFFVTEETGDPQRMDEFWTTASRSALTPAELDVALDGMFPFGDHFRDFTVRNFNRDLPGSPIAAAHTAWDEALPFGGSPYESWVLEPAITLRAAVQRLPWPLQIQPLAMQTDHIVLTDNLRHFKVDATALGGAGHLNLDVIVKVGDEWERRRLGAPIFEFCREDEADDISELYLIFSNFNHDRNAELLGDAQVTTALECPGGWRGTIRTVLTLEDQYERTTPSGTEVYNRSEREVQTWTVVGEEEISMGPTTYDELALQWTATYERDIVLDFTPVACLGDAIHTAERVTGTGEATDFVGMFPGGAGMYTVNPTRPSFSEIQCSGSVSWDYCTGDHASENLTDTRGNALAVALFAQGGPSVLEPVEGSNWRYTGSATILHDEQPQDGGSVVLDQTVTWDLTRSSP